MTIKELQKEVHNIAKKSGWYDGELGKLTDLRIASLLCLIHSEISEALEDFRHGRMDLTFGPNGKPEGFPSELADVVIRILDLSEALGIDLEEVIIAKNFYNRTRTYKHGNKKM